MVNIEDIEKLKNLLIKLDLKYKAMKDELNVEGLMVLMTFDQEYRQFNTVNALDVINNLSDQFVTTKRALELACEEMLENTAFESEDDRHYALQENIEYFRNMARKERRMKNKKLVYVCSKYRGDVELNTHFALGYCNGLYKLGYIPIAPHLYFTRFLDDNDPKEREDGLKMGLRLLKLCDELWVFDKDNVSEGMQMEIDFAKKHDIPIKYFC